jgi:uncharacterized protein (UPF0332 family)
VDKATLSHEVSNSLLLLEEELRSFVANAAARTYRKAVHNLYYAALDAASALLWSKGIRIESHDAAQSLLSLHFVKSGALPRDTASRLNDLMAKRHAADYKGAVPIGAEDVSRFRPWVVEFVRACLALIKKGGLRVNTSAAEEAAERAGRVRIDEAGNERGTF